MDPLIGISHAFCNEKTGNMATNPATSTPIKGVAVPTKQLEPTDLLFGECVSSYSQF
jgi:hypothetical protein